MCDKIVPKRVRDEDLYPPNDLLESVLWVIERIDVNDITELSYKDYETECSVYTRHFEELFYHIDATLEQLRTLKEIKEPLALDILHDMTLIQYRHGCLRQYDSFNAVCRIFLVKAYVFITEMIALSALDKPYYQKRLRYIVRDIEVLTYTLYERNHSNTLS